MLRNHWPWLAGALAALIVCGAAALHSFIPGLAAHAGDFDMISMLKEMDRANRDIGETNESILLTLDRVKERTGRVREVSRQMEQIDGGLQEQAEVLDRLRVITARQAEMSQALYELTASVVPSTERLAQSAANQAAAVERMGATTGQLARQLEEIGAVNRSSLSKLNRAEQLSADVLSRMP